MHWWRRLGVVLLLLALAGACSAQRYSLVPLSEELRDKGFIFWDMSLILAQGSGDLSSGNVAMARREEVVRAQASVLTIVARLLDRPSITTGSFVGG